MTPTVEFTPGRALAAHWPEYLMEAAALGIFMLSACVFGTLLEHPAAQAHRAIPDAFARRGVMGLAMGTTAVAIIVSPWGQRSGAHMNPSVTLTFALLGKIARWDALFYVAAQFCGGILGVQLAHSILGMPLTHGAVNYVATVPGRDGELWAFTAEFGISALLMAAILVASNSRLLAAWTPLIAGLLVAVYILFEAPLSGMSMNPARTFGSAVAASDWRAWWIYFVAPPLGMLAAGGLWVLCGRAVRCAKLHHDNGQRCIFRCAYFGKESK